MQNPTTPTKGIVLRVADAADREAIYRIRHAVYAAELAQHLTNSQGALRDRLDDSNVYIVAHLDNELAGFISITKPGPAGYSIDKYFARDSLPFAFDAGLYEIRLLTVPSQRRGRDLAALLMYAAFRWVEAHGGTQIVAIGRREVLDMYTRNGLEPVGLSVQSGAVTFDLLQVTVPRLRDHMQSRERLLGRLHANTDWRLDVPFHRPAPCLHGGAFFDAVGPRFETLERSRDVINADVLDAWFPPAPGVLSALHEHLPWLARTSPPTDCEGMIAAIAQARGVGTANILPGAGSSDLIFRAFRHWLHPGSRALILDPTYGEYAHVLERVVGCKVDRLVLTRDLNYELELAALEEALSREYDLAVLVNPNSPTGRHTQREALERLLMHVPATTRIWLDETYVEYAGTNESLEAYAAASENVIVCKSMSKAYALSGLRAAYLCAGPHQLEELRAITPPWAVSLPAQVAVVRALEDPEYYVARYAETGTLRDELASELRALGMDVIPGVANFILSHLPTDGPDAATVVARCRQHGLFIRDTAAMGSNLSRHALRIAVKDAATNCQIVMILGKALQQG